MKIDEIRKMSNDEMVKEIESLKQELFQLRFQQATGQLTNSAQMKNIKKTIARMKTVMLRENSVKKIKEDEIDGKKYS